jgi:hypothetical protein
VIRWAGRAIAAWAKPRADLIVENLCLRQQLIVLQRRAPRPRLRDGDRRFWIFFCRWFPKWRDSLLVVQAAPGDDPRCRFEAGLRLEVDGLLECIASEDVVEGLRAFAERRRPFYRGR